MLNEEEVSRHALIAVFPKDAEYLTGEELDLIVRTLLAVPEPSKAGALFDTVRRVTSGTGIGSIDDARLLYTLEREGFHALSEADRRHIYAAARLPMRALVRAYLAQAPDRFAGASVLMLRTNDPRLHALRCVGRGFAIRHVYAAHPHEPGLYIPVSQFHSYLLEAKRSEFVRLMTSLGARTVRLTHAESEETSARANAGVDGVKGVDVGVKAGVRASKGSRFSLAMTIEERPTRPPEMPSNLVWYHHEPMWQALCDARLAFGATSFKVGFSYKSDFGVDASLCAKITGMGLEVGGKFEENEALEQEYEVTFWPRGRGEP
jgi:hypothetical protein